MRSTRIIKSETFRHTALFALLFLVLTGALIGTVLWIVQSTQQAALIRANEADIATVMNGFGDEGIDEAVEVVKQRLGPRRFAGLAAEDCYIVLQDKRGEKIVGNLPTQPRRLGNVGLTVDKPAPSVVATRAAARAIQLLGRGVELPDGAYLFVARSTQPITETRERIFNAFIWLALGASVMSIAAGIFLSARFTQRIDAIAATCAGIIAGRLQDRIPVAGSGDEWDRLAGTINEMLNRISALLDNLRQVSSDVAHDLRTPLARLRNRLETARANPDATKNPAVIAAAIEDTDQLLSLFSALLRISQVQAGSRAASFAAVDLSDIGEKIYRIFEPVADDSRHRFEAQFAAPAMVHGDAELLTQMLTNLVENALRHTPPQTRLLLGTCVTDGRAFLSVEDNGPGIAAEDRGKVVRRFYRVSTSRHTSGHGLGLALVAAVVQLHNATLTLTDANPGLRVLIGFPRPPAP